MISIEKYLDDKNILTFLNNAEKQNEHLNIPFLDGALLFEKILSIKAQNILEIGTSTGYSTVWLAAAAKITHGHVTTLEIDPDRHKKALSYFKELGLEPFITAHLIDAHIYVENNQQNFDFIFSDADKYYYPEYFLKLKNKLNLNGYFATHNVLQKGGKNIEDYKELLCHDALFETVFTGSSKGLAFSKKISL